MGNAIIEIAEPHGLTNIEERCARSDRSVTQNHRQRGGFAMLISLIFSGWYHNGMAMRLKMTMHFQARMVERGIQIQHVKQAIRLPDSTEKREDGIIVSTKELADGRVIEVVYSQERFRDAHDYLMITAYYKTP